MPKTKEELDAISAEVAKLEEELQELTDEELDEVTGGIARRAGKNGKETGIGLLSGLFMKLRAKAGFGAAAPVVDALEAVTGAAKALNKTDYI